MPQEAVERQQRVLTGEERGMSDSEETGAPEQGAERRSPPPVYDARSEDLGDDVRALAIVARSVGRASVVRRVDGQLVRVIVEAA
jgi:hypothetical protein